MNILLNLNSVVLLFTLAANLGLSIFVYFKDRKNEINKSFAGLLFSIALWTLTIILFLHARNPEEALLIRRLTPIGPGFLMAFFLYFTLVFPRPEKKYSLALKALLFIPAVIFMLASVLTNLMIKGIYVQMDLPLYLAKPIFGDIYGAYAFYLLAFLGFSVFYLARKYLRYEGKDRLPVRCVMVGTALTGAAGILTGLILPLFGFIDFFTFGPVFTLFMGGFISYAIVKYRLLDIGSFLGQGLLFVNFIIALIALFVFFINQFNFSSLISFWAFMANLTLALYIYLYNPKSAVNKIFSLMVFSVAFWILGILAFTNYREVAVFTYFWAKEYYVFGTAIPVLLVSFSYYFPTERIKPTNTLKSILFLFTVSAWVIICFTEWIVKEIVMRPWGPEVILGWFYNYYSFLYVLLFGFAFINLFRKFIAASGANRVQLKYVLLGTFIAALFGVFFNLILPLLGNYKLIWVGPNASIIFVAFTAYAVLKHRLMSIEVVIQRGTVYAFATVLIMAVYALAVIISETFLRKIMGYTSLFVTAAAALLIAVAYQPLVRFFQRLSDRLFFRGRYDYQRTLREISHQIASVIRLEELTKLISSSFVDTMKVSEISFLLLGKEKEHFRSVPLSLPRYKKIEINVGSPIISRLVRTKDILVRDEIEEKIERQESQGLEEVRDEMQRLGISIWVPIVSKEELIGIIALGDKLSGDVFTSEDIGLLSTLASQTAVALDNARLYNEVVTMKDYHEEILQSMVSGVLTVDNRERVVTFNNMAEKITGRKITEVLGKTCGEVWGKRGTVAQVIKSSLNNKSYVNYESGIASPERGLIPVSLSSTLLRDQQNKKIGVLLTIQDLTEVKELEEKVRRADKLSALATMAAGMAHEIKNPLSSMKVLSQLLPLRFNDPEYRGKLQEILPREIDRIDRIVESLLGFARATAPTFEKVNVNHALAENIKYFDDQAQASEVKVITDFSDLPEIEMDQSQVSQVFSNLILNAIQAMPNGGALRVSTFAGKKVEEILQQVKIQISDTGYGISEDKLKKLFDPFFTTKHGGTGLGLTICHSIIDGHRGYIDVESKVGQGTTFTITLPVTQGLL